MRITISLIFVLVVASAVPAAAGGAHADPSGASPVVSLEAPQPGAVITGSVDLVVSADDATGDEAVELRALAGGEVLGEVTRLEVDPAPGDTEGAWRWQAPLDTSGWPNGEVELEVRAVLAGDGDGSGCHGAEGSGDAACPWVGHGIVLEMPPAPDVSFEVEGTTVTLTWAPVDSPEVSGYRVERETGGAFEEVATVPPAGGQMSHTESDLAPGSHTFQVRAARPLGEGGEALSSPATVTVTIEESGEPDPEETEEPDPEKSEEPEDPQETEEPEDPQETEEPEDPQETEEPEDPQETEEPEEPREPEDSSAHDEQPVRRPTLEPLNRTGQPARAPSAGGAGDGDDDAPDPPAPDPRPDRRSQDSERPSLSTRPADPRDRSPDATGPGVEDFDWQPRAPEVAGPEVEGDDEEEVDGVPLPEAAPPEQAEVGHEPAGGDLDDERSLAGDRMGPAPGSIDIALLFWAGLLAAVHQRIIGRRRVSRP